MPLVNVRVEALLATLALPLLAAGCGSDCAGRAAASVVAPPSFTVVDDAQVGLGVGRFDYQGRWEHIRIADGRDAGTSTRSRREPSVAVFPFYGTRVRLYGVCGPGGGLAQITLDGAEQLRPVTFDCRRKTVHKLVYESAELKNDVHYLTIGVLENRYVNLDDAIVEK